MKLIYCFISAMVAASAYASSFTDQETWAETINPVAVYSHHDDLLQTAEQDHPGGMSIQREETDGMPFDECVTIQLDQPGSSPYAMNLQFFHTNQWSAGDSGLITFYARMLTTENEYGASSLKIQYKPDYKDWRGHKETDLYLSKDWKQILIPFKVTIDAPDTDQTALSFFLGGVDPHTFQMAGLTVYNFKKSVPFKDLPISKTYYPGIEADAPWRSAAAERIEKLRKADLTLKLTDSNGTPLAGANVDIKLKRHKFGFGAAVHTPQLVSPKISSNDRRQYSDILTRTCSKITPTNAMKWRLYNHFKEHVPALIAWCEEHDMTLRGHLFIWPGFERLPDGYDLYKTDPAAFRKDLTDHITEFANLFPDAFSEWDVMNEPYTEHDYMDLLGKDVVLEWFETARKANPNYLTYINDYGILSDNNQEHQDNYDEWITYLIAHDAPLDGIGFQGHFKTAMPPEVILERIDRYARFGKKMQITEFDFKHTDPVLQARFFEDFVTLIYSHPQMEALINWIFLEDDFRPEAALYRKDFTPTAMGKVWERLLTQQWHTEESLTTDTRGEVNLRGYKGLYEIKFIHHGKKYTRQLDLPDDLKAELSF